MSRPRDRRPLADAELVERIRIAIGKHGPISQAQLYEHVGGSAKRFRAALRELLEAGYVATIAPATRRGPRRHPLFVLPVATSYDQSRLLSTNRDSCRHDGNASATVIDMETANENESKVRVDDTSLLTQVPAADRDALVAGTANAIAQLVRDGNSDVIAHHVHNGTETRCYLLPRPRGEKGN